MRSVGLDLGVRKICFCEVRDGKVVDRRTVKSLRELDDVLGPKAAKANVALEACREAWHVNDELEKHGHQVALVDTTRVRKLGIGQHGRKTDAIDAEVLARALEAGHIPHAHKLSKHRQDLRTQVMIRRGLAEMRAHTVVTIRGVLRANGVRVPKCEAAVFMSRYEKCEVPSAVHETVAPLIAMLVALEPQITRTEQMIASLAEKEPMVKFLMTAPGVGLLVAAMFVSVVDDAARFKSAHHLQSYLGLVPSENSSGGQRRLGSISKHGNAYMRVMLTQAAWAIAFHNATPETEPLHIWARAIAERRGRRVAITALARRLAGVLWAMWRDGTVYDPQAVGMASSEGKLRSAQRSEVQARALARAATKLKYRLRERKISNALSA